MEHLSLLFGSLLAWPFKKLDDLYTRRTGSFQFVGGIAVSVIATFIVAVVLVSSGIRRPPSPIGPGWREPN